MDGNLPLARTLYGGAAYKCTTRCTVGTATHGNVIDDIANGVLATGTRTGIEALAAQTGLVARTVRVENTFRTTSRVGITAELGQTAAYAVIALRIGSAGRGLAAIDILVWVKVYKVFNDVVKGAAMTRELT